MTNFPLWRLLREDLRGRGTELLVATLGAGTAFAGVLMVLNLAGAAIAARQMEVRTLLLFLFCVGVFVWTRRYASAEFARLAHSAIANLRARFTQKIRRSGLLQLEGMTESRLLPVLTEHTEHIATGASALNRGLPSLVMLCVSLIYIAMLSKPGFFLCVAVLVGIFFISRRTGAKIGTAMGESMAAERRYFDLVGHLLRGFKEVKTNRRKADDLLGAMELVSQEARASKERLDVMTERFILLVETLFFGLLGAVVFVLPGLSSLPSKHISDILTVAIFITGNIAVLGDAWPKIARANHTIGALSELEGVLDSFDDMKATAPVDLVQAHRDFKVLHLRDVYFRYPTRDGQTPYSVGPMSLEAKRGEMIFVCGGNGSGKSTLLKALAGLYPLTDGRLVLDDLPIGPAEADHYRQLVSVVFTDYHLFDRLYGMADADEARVRALLVRLGLEGKTDFRDGKFTNLELSTGQRKRLGLLVALIDDRPICIFDEIAADQDPEFRRELYEKWLPELRAQGRLVIVATHDDAHFKRADRVLHMQDGHIVKEDRA